MVPSEKNRCLERWNIQIVSARLRGEGELKAKNIVEGEGEKGTDAVLPARSTRCDAKLTSFLNAFSYRILRFLVEHLRSVRGEKRRFYRRGVATQQRWGFWRRRNLKANRLEAISSWWRFSPIIVLLLRDDGQTVRNSSFISRFNFRSLNICWSLIMNSAGMPTSCEGFVTVRWLSIAVGCMTYS